MRNPFPGPRPIGQSEPIFGRDREITGLRHLLIAERLVLLHSPSGAGKSSLINAGLIPELENIFDVWEPTRVNTQPPPEVLTNRYVWSTIDGWKKPGDQPTLKEFVTANTAHKNPLLIFDQFEEILRTSPTDTDGQKEFFRQLADLLAFPNIWALLLIREEYLAPLLPHFATLPTHIRHRFRLDLLTEIQAKTAMRNTATVGGRVFLPQALAALTGRLADVSGFIEPMHLQVVCRQLWDAMPDNDLSVDPVDVDRFGDVTAALRAYYDGCVKDVRAIREWFQEKLIKNGIRGQVQMGAETSEGLPNEVIETLLDTHLIRAEERRRNRWVELAHDRLIEPVQLSNQEWFDKNLHLTQKQAALWAKQNRLESLLLPAELLATHRRWIVENADRLSPAEQQFLVASEKRRLREQREQDQQTRIRQALSRSIGLDARIEMDGDRNALVLAKLALALRLDSASIAARAWIADLLQHQGWWLEADIARTSSIHVGDRFNWNGAYSPNGDRFLAPAAECEVLCVWDLESGQRRFCHGPVTGGDVSPDGMRIVAKAPWGREFVVFDSSGDIAEGIPLLQPSTVRRAFFANDGRCFITVDILGTARIWQSASGERIGNEVHPSQWPFTSPDGTRMLTVDSLSTIVVLEAATGKRIGPPRSLPENAILSALAFSPDGCRAMASIRENGSVNCSVDVWDIQSGERLCPQIAHRDVLWDPVLSFGGSCIATADGPQIVRLTVVSGGERASLLLQHDAFVESVSFSPDGSRVLTAAADMLARLWDTATGYPIVPALLHESSTAGPHPRFSPDGTRIVTCPPPGGVQLWDASTGNPVAVGPPLPDDRFMDFSADSRFFLTASDIDCSVCVWDSATGACGSPRLLHDGPVLSAKFASGHRGVITKSYSSLLQIFAIDGQSRIGNPILLGNPVRQASFSPNADSVATAAGRLAQLWDATTGESIGSPLEHRGELNTVAFSSDARFLVTASHDQTAQVWDAVSGAKIGHPLVHDTVVRSAAFTPDCRAVLTVSGNAGQLWDVATSRKYGPAFEHEKDVYAASISADGLRIATASADGNVQVWSTSTCARIGPSLSVGYQVRMAIFTADGQRLLTVSVIGQLELWDISSGNMLWKQGISSGGRFVFSAGFSQQERLLVTVSSQERVQIWDPLTGKEIAETPALDDRRLEIERDGSSVAITTVPPPPVFWPELMREPAPQEPAYVLAKSPEIAGGVVSASFSADGSRVVTTAAGGLIQVWDAHTFEPIGPRFRRSGSAALTPDGSFLVTRTDMSGAVRVSAWRLAPTAPPASVLLASSYASAAAFSPDGRLVAVGSGNGETTIWGTANRTQFGNPIVHGQVPQSVAFSPDGRTVKVVTADGTVSHWQFLAGEWCGVPTDAFTGTTPRLVTIVGHAAQIIDGRTGEPLGRRMEDVHPIFRAVLSPDHSRVITCARNIARIWDATTGRPLTPPMDHPAKVVCVAFNPCGDRVATATLDSTASIWNVATGTPIGQPLDHGEQVEIVEFSPDGRFVLTGFGLKSRSIRIWDATTGDAIASYPIGGPSFATFSPDGQQILTSNKDHHACLHRFLIDSGTPEDTDLLAEFAEAVAGHTASKDGALAPIDQYAALRRVIEKAEKNPGSLGTFIRQYIPQ